MVNERMDELLSAAAGALEDGRDPLSIELLREHSITSEETSRLTYQMAQVLRGYVAAPRDVRLAVLLCSTAGDIGLPPAYLSAIALKNEALRQIVGLSEEHQDLEGGVNT